MSGESQHLSEEETHKFIAALNSPPQMPHGISMWETYRSGKYGSTGIYTQRQRENPFQTLEELADWLESVLVNTDDDQYIRRLLELSETDVFPAKIERARVVINHAERWRDFLLKKTHKRHRAPGSLDEATNALAELIVEFRSDSDRVALEESVPPGDMVPIWDAELHELKWRGEVVREIRPIANKAIKILNAFQEEGWPRKIYSPLEHCENLSEAVRTLNNGLVHLVFKRDGSAEGILWSEVDSE